MECSTQEIIKTIAISITSMIAVFTIIKGYLEYKLFNKQKRSELYEEYRKKMKENDLIKNTINLLETENDKKIKEIPRIEKYFFLGFFEDIALLMNTKLIKPEIAHYMFGYYALKCWENESFWEEINRNSHYWRVFKEFVEKMKELEDKGLTISSNKKIKFEI